MSQPIEHDGKFVVGRLEAVRLPAWRIGRVRAKIDTGARTSALHVDNIRRIDSERVHFEVVLSRTITSKRVPVEAPIVRTASVRSSSGHEQERIVVATTLKLGPVEKEIEVTLVDRGRMLCRMLLGRTALEGLLVDVSRKFIHGGFRRRKKRST